MLVERELGNQEALFPQPRRLRQEFQDMIQRNVFRGFDLRIDRSRPQKRLVLGPEDRPLPFMAWSAGQREFVPLLLGFYWLMPPSKAKTRDTIEWVVLEELETGLHPPRNRSTPPDDDGTRVPRLPGLFIVLTPPRCWRPSRALQRLIAYRGSPRRCWACSRRQTQLPLRKLAETVMTKRAKVYYFDPTTGTTTGYLRARRRQRRGGRRRVGRSERVQRPGQLRGGQSRGQRQEKSRTMTFRNAVHETPDFRGAWRRGLRALGTDSRHVAASNPRTIAGSVNIEECLKKSRDAERQWDYAVGHKPSNRGTEVVYWIEVHPAYDHEIKVVKEKLNSLRNWLRTSAPRLNEMDGDFCGSRAAIPPSRRARNR